MVINECGVRHPMYYASNVSRERLHELTQGRKCREKMVEVYDRLSHENTTQVAKPPSQEKETMSAATNINEMLVVRFFTDFILR